MRYLIWMGDRIGRSTKHRPPVRVAAFSLVLMIALAACGAASDNNDSGPDAVTDVSSHQDSPTAALQPTTAELSAAPSAQAVNIVFDFQIDDVYSGADKLGGETIAFSSLFGGDKPIILNFWAGLCPPCRAEMPDFQEA